MGTSDVLYNQILSNGPSPGTLFLVLSRLKEEGHLKWVIQECIKALNIYPEDINIRQLLAESYFETGLLSQAEAELEKVTTQINNLISAYKLRAEIYARQGRIEGAAQALKVYLVHRPEDQESLDLLERIKPSEKPPASETIPVIKEVPGPAEKFFEELPAAPEEEIAEIVTPKLAEIYLDQGLIKEAINTYKKVIEQNPKDERSIKRLEELKIMIEVGEAVDDIDFDTARSKKEKMITILEGWIDNIREWSKHPITA